MNIPSGARVLGPKKENSAKAKRLMEESLRRFRERVEEALARKKRKDA